MMKRSPAQMEVADRELPEEVLEKMKRNPAEMEVADGELPEEVLEMVIAKMPFPFLFKARVLSKGWYLKFPSKTCPESSSQMEVSCIASTFRSQVCANSASWGTSYAPVFVDWTSNLLLAFDRIVPRWLAPLPPSSNNVLPYHSAISKPSVWVAGSLVLVAGRRLAKFATVFNVITGSCRKLKLPLRASPHTEGNVCLIAVDCHSYKVLVVYFELSLMRGRAGMETALCVQLYDSNSQMWTQEKYMDIQALHGLLYFSDHCAYMDGKVYFSALFKSRAAVVSLKLVTYDLETTAWTVCEAFVPDDEAIGKCGVFRCDNKVIVTVTSRDGRAFGRSDLEKWNTVVQREEYMDATSQVSVYSFGEKSILVFQLDIQSLKLVLISDGPPEIMGSLERPGPSRYKYPNYGMPGSKWSKYPERRLSADANFLYFGWDRLPSPVVKFDVNGRQWNSTSVPLVSSTPAFNWKRHDLDWIHGALEPGLNPFVSP